MSDKKLFIGISQKDVDRKIKAIDEQKNNAEKLERAALEKQRQKKEQHDKKIADRKLARSIFPTRYAIRIILVKQLIAFAALLGLGSVGYVFYEYDANGSYDRDLEWKNEQSIFSFEDNPYFRSFREAYTFKNALATTQEWEEIKAESKKRGEEIGNCDVFIFIIPGVGIECGKNVIPATKGIITYGVHLFALLSALFVFIDPKRLAFAKSVVNRSKTEDKLPDGWQDICASLIRSYPELFHDSMDGKIVNTDVAQELIYQHLRKKPEDIKILKECFEEISIPDRIMNIKGIQRYNGR
jgi:hypothetical protein